MTILLLLALLLIVAAWLLHADDCLRYGHAWTFCVDPDRIFLTCVVCHTESPGWHLSRSATHES